MTDFFDWLTAADSGLGTDRLREQFRLSQQEMRRTTEALAPAFLFGMQRLMADPEAWTRFMRRVASLGLDEVSAGTESMSPAATGALFAKMFGTPTLADSIARHASLMADVAPDTIRKIMPELALLTVQTMMRTAAAHQGSMSAGALPADAGGQAMAEIMRRSANAVEAFSRPATTGNPTPPASSYLESLFADALKGSFPWMQPAGPAPSAERSPSGPERREPEPFFPPYAMFAPFLGALSGADTRKVEKADRAAQADPDRKDAGGTDPLAQMSRMMQAGRSAQETYALEMLALFDRHRPDRR